MKASLGGRRRAQASRVPTPAAAWPWSHGVGVASLAGCEARLEPGPGGPCDGQVGSSWTQRAPPPEMTGFRRPLQAPASSILPLTVRVGTPDPAANRNLLGTVGSQHSVDSCAQTFACLHRQARSRRAAGPRGGGPRHGRGPAPSITALARVAADTRQHTAAMRAVWPRDLELLCAELRAICTYLRGKIVMFTGCLGFLKTTIVQLPKW